jgi:hypothetical protein
VTTSPITDQLVHGAIELEHTDQGLLPHRLPARARAQCPDQRLHLAESQPSGVRLVVHTRATTVELDTTSTRIEYEGVPPRPRGVFDLLVDGALANQVSATGGTVVTIDPTTGTSRTTPGATSTVRFSDLPAHDKRVEIWLPHNEITHLVALRTDAAVAPVPRGDRVWLHHGSSISQGSNAASPSTTWPALAAARGAVDLINLGFSGSALLDPFTARTLRDTPADVVSVKLGINVVNADLMRRRAFVPAVHGFLDTIREGHPTTPLLVISPLWCPIHEHTPGPGAFDVDALREGVVRFRATGDPTDPSRLTLSTVRDDLAAVVAQRAESDPNLHYLDGRTLYGEADAADLPLPDALHPDSATHRRIGDRFADLVFGPGGVFARD